MKKTNFEKVKEFHEKFGHPVRNTPQMPEENEQILAEDLITEEWRETLQAVAHEDIVEIADGIADTIWCLYGMAARYGIDIDAVMEEVYQSNMSKLGEDGKPIYREDGKILKGPNFKKPDIAKVLKICKI